MNDYDMPVKKILTIQLILAAVALCVMSAGSFAVQDVFSQLVTDGGRSDLRNVTQINRQDLSRIVRQKLAEKAGDIRQYRENLKNQGLEVGVNVEITLAPGVTVSIAAEDLASAATWDRKSMPDFPFNLKVEAKTPAGQPVGKEGAIEVRYNPANKDTYGIEYIQFEGKRTIGPSVDRVTVKISGTADKPVIEIEGGKGLTTSEALKEATGWEFGAEQSFGIDTSRSTDDYYTEDMERSDWMIVRGVENLITKIKWGVSVNVGYEKEIDKDTKIKGGGKYTVGTDQVRNWYTDWIFSDADKAADNLNDQLDWQKQWRRKKIEEEARKRGVDPTGKDTATLIREVKDARKKQGVTTPVFRRPYPPKTKTPTPGTTPTTPTSGGGLPMPTGTGPTPGRTPQLDKFR